MPKTKDGFPVEQNRRVDHEAVITEVDAMEKFIQPEGLTGGECAIQIESEESQIGAIEPFIKVARDEIMTEKRRFRIEWYNYQDGNPRVQNYPAIAFIRCCVVESGELREFHPCCLDHEVKQE